MSGSEAYASALERAKQIVSKFSSDDTNSNGPLAGMKRPAQDDNCYVNEKRPFVNDKVAAAAEAAARINQKLGGIPAQVPPPGASRVMTTEIKIPDRFVGLIIGKKGEQITQLQNDSACKVQVSQETGRPERTVTLSGTSQQIDTARHMINDILEKADKSATGVTVSTGATQSTNYASGAMSTIELMIPGNKAGLVIGKNGETIKHLQEENGVKMILIQQTNAPTVEDKPLRISGDPSRVEHVKQLVLELINARERAAGARGGYGYDGQETSRYAVPAEKAGLVIGKGGESIKEIIRVSGAHVEISKEPPPDPSIKIFNIRGSRNEIDVAIRMISERAGIPMTRAAGAGAWGQSSYSQDGWGNGAAAGQMPAPTYNPYTGQPDYSAAWAEYYRRQNMHEYADAIIRQAQQPPATVPPAAATPPQPTAPGMHPAQAGMPTAPAPGAYPAQPAAPGQYDYNQWQWHWQAWQQAWQQQQPQPGQQPGSLTAPPTSLPPVQAPQPVGQ